MRELSKEDWWHCYNNDKDELRRKANAFFDEIFTEMRVRGYHSRDIQLALIDSLHSVASANRGLEERNTGE